MVNVLIIAATEVELKAFFPSDFSHGGINLVSAVLGVGKVASVRLDHVLSRYKFDVVFEVGSCGSAECVSGTLVTPNCLFNSGGSEMIELDRADSSIQAIHDMNLIAFPPSALLEVANFVTNETGLPTIGSTANIVYDMESYSIGDVCIRQKVCFHILKIVVDGRDAEIKSISDYLSFERAFYNKKAALLQSITRDAVLSVCCALLNK